MLTTEKQQLEGKNMQSGKELAEIFFQQFFIKQKLLPVIPLLLLKADVQMAALLKLPAEVP